MQIDASPRAAGKRLAWSWRWETSVSDLEHVELASLLGQSFPSRTTSLTDGRSWVGARPELRVVGRLHGDVVAHGAVIRRLLRVPDHRHSVLVGDVGLVAVHPSHRGLGLGAELMAALAAVLEQLAVPYGFLTCGPHARPFYERTGWITLEGAVRSIGIDHLVEDHSGPAMLLPVLAPFDDWPAGDVHRDGQEI